MAVAGSLSGLLRRARRRADMSQREMAAAAAIAKSTLAAAEAGTRDLAFAAVTRVVAAAGLRLALLDDTGSEIAAMSGAAVRDGAGRYFPAHLDTLLSEERRWRWEHRPHLRRPAYTFDRRDPWNRPGSRASENRPDDHLLPEVAAARRAQLVEQVRDQRGRRGPAAEPRPLDDGWTCACPPVCDELDDWSGRPVHAEECPCRCDID